MKLHIGGEETKHGWKILNIQKKNGVDFVGDITDLSQFLDCSISEIYASHVFEHVKQNDIKKTLRGIYRVLKKDGKFYVSVPDMEILCKGFIDSKAPHKVKLHIMQMIFGGQTDQFDFHYFGWSQDFLKSFLLEAGFKEIKRVKSFLLFNDTSDYAPYGVPISLNIIANK
jgi:predicted SAM-dependent methyltransferase